MGASLEIFTFHKDTTTVGVGQAYTNEQQASKIKIEFVVNTGTTFTAVFEAQVNADKWYPYTVFQIPSYDMPAQVTSADYMYECDISGINKLRVKLTAINGKVSCYGRVVK